MTVYEILTDQLHSLLIVDVCSCCVVCCRKFSSTPDDQLFRELAKSYSLPHSLMAHSPKCPGDSHPFAQGITNGADWYPVAGGMQVSHCSKDRVRKRQKSLNLTFKILFKSIHYINEAIESKKSVFPPFKWTIGCEFHHVYSPGC